MLRLRELFKAAAKISVTGIGSLIQLLAIIWLQKFANSSELADVFLIQSIVSFLTVSITLRLGVDVVLETDIQNINKLTVLHFYTSLLLAVFVGLLGCIVLVMSYDIRVASIVYLWLLTTPFSILDARSRSRRRYLSFSVSTIGAASFLMALLYLRRPETLVDILLVFALSEVLRAFLRLITNLDLATTIVRTPPISKVFVNLHAVRGQFIEVGSKSLLNQQDFILGYFLVIPESYVVYKVYRELGGFFIKVIDVFRLLIIPEFKGRKKVFIWRLWKNLYQFLPFILCGVLVIFMTGRSVLMFVAAHLIIILLQLVLPTMYLIDARKEIIYTYTVTLLTSFFILIVLSNFIELSPSIILFINNALLLALSILFIYAKTRNGSISDVI